MLSRYAIMALINDCQFIITRNKGGKIMQILAAVAGAIMMICKIGGAIAF